MAREKLYVKCTLEPKYWTEKQDEFRRIANNRNVMYEPTPVKVHYIGNIFLFQPECELPEPVARVLVEKRWYVKQVGEPYYKLEPGEIPTDAKDEDDHKYGEAYLCRHCGWPYPKAMSRATHERQWCKRKDN